MNLFFAVLLIGTGLLQLLAIKKKRAKKKGIAIEIIIMIACFSLAVVSLVLL